MKVNSRHSSFLILFKSLFKIFSKIQESFDFSHWFSRSTFESNHITTSSINNLFFHNQIYNSNEHEHAKSIARKHSYQIQNKISHSYQYSRHWIFNVNIIDIMKRNNYFNINRMLSWYIPASFRLHISTFARIWRFISMINFKYITHTMRISLARRWISIFDTRLQ